MAPCRDGDLVYSQDRFDRALTHACLSAALHQGHVCRERCVLQICAGRKVFARSGNNHDPRNRVVAQALGSVFKLGQMGMTQCVGPLGPMHGESGDQPLASEGDKLVVGSRVIFHADILRRDRRDVRA